MTDIQSTLGTVAELFTWVGLILGGLCFLMLMILRAIRGGWADVEAIVIDRPDAFSVRWMAPDGTIYDRRLSPAEAAEITNPEELRVYYRLRYPDVGVLEPIDHSEQILRLLGLILLGLAAVAIIVSVVIAVAP